MSARVASGGNEYPNDNTKYPVRFYVNNGKGIFSSSKYSYRVFTSANSISVSDFNKDGSTDIFIGGRSVPGHYGIVPNSFLISIVNDSLVNYSFLQLAKVGMITTSTWADVNNDGWNDLVIAGEWMPVTIFHNEKGILNTEPVTIANTNGWWNKIITTDIDKDGDLDIVAGNLGMNTRYRGLIDRPVTMVVSDFDDNGSTDCIISTYVKGKSYPIAIRDYVLDQMPFLRKKFLRYKQYSEATLQDIFSAAQLAKAENFYANNMYSSVFLNDGAGNFIPINLPDAAQLFPVNGIQVTDVNADAIADLLLAGNDFSTEVETGRNDAGIGLTLIGKGDGTFTTMPVIESGFFIPGDVKCLEKIAIKNKVAFIAGKNKGKLQVVSR